jgi:acetylornithine/N-succinyldiaminopimelate aminotransferase
MNRAHIFPSYSPPDISFSHGSGSWLTDRSGKRYLDFISGISVNTLGHAHPDLVEALYQQSQKLWHLSNMFDVPGQTELAERYCQYTFADRVFFTNSGAESVECALKSARKFHAVSGHAEKIEIIGFEGAFHGRTYASINAAGNPKYLKDFGPSLPGYTHAKFNDLTTVEPLINEATAGIIVEPIQGEGGLRAGTGEFLQGLRKLCDQHQLLLIYDEVQCGAGRTGKLFAHQWFEQAEPDIMATAKGVGGGFPFGMCLATEAVATHMLPGTHGTTYGGNALACAVGAAVLNHLTAPSFLSVVCKRSEVLESSLDSVASAFPSLILGLRGKGLLAGLALHPSVSNLEIRNQVRADGLLVGVAGDNTIRLAPPLNVSEDEIHLAAETLHTAFERVSKHDSLTEQRAV